MLLPPHLIQGVIVSGDTWQNTFVDEEEFDYYCILHSFMTGKVIVSAEKSTQGSNYNNFEGSQNQNQTYTKTSVAANNKINLNSLNQQQIIDIISSIINQQYPQIDKNQIIQALQNFAKNTQLKVRVLSLYLDKWQKIFNKTQMDQLHKRL
jgi:hypothetical protein